MGQKEKAARSNVEMRRKYPHEDRALKAAGQMLGEALISLTELGVKVRRMISTEQIVLHTEEFVEDFNYETDTNEIAHLEFESDEITREDLMRFRGYEAVLSYQQKKDVFTCVLCTADAEVLLSEIQTGMNVYRVKVIHLKEEIKVTQLGQMLFDDGWNEGMMQGISQGIFQGITQGITTGMADIIRNTMDENKLKSWGKIASRAESVDEFCEKAGIEK